MNNAFNTSRLRVFQSEPFALCDEFSASRTLFIAFPLDTIVHPPCPIVTAVLTDYRFLHGRLTLDWIETASAHRRQGYATEVVNALSQLLDFAVTPHTEFGKQFLRSLGGSHDGA